MNYPAWRVVSPSRALVLAHQSRTPSCVSWFYHLPVGLYRDVRDRNHGPARHGVFSPRQIHRSVWDHSMLRSHSVIASLSARRMLRVSTHSIVSVLHIIPQNFVFTRHWMQWLIDCTFSIIRRWFIECPGRYMGCADSGTSSATALHLPLIWCWKPGRICMCANQWVAV